MTLGLEVLVHDVMDAMTTSPFLTVVALPFTAAGIAVEAVFSEKYDGEIFS